MHQYHNAVIDFTDFRRSETNATASVCDCRFWTGLRILIDALCTDLTFAFGMFILSNVAVVTRKSIGIKGNMLASEGE